MRRFVVPGALGVVALVGGLMVVFGGGGSDDDPAGSGGTTSTSMETGGIDVPAPDGWRAVPIPSLGFGVAIPQGWEAVVLDEEVLEDVARSSPAVPGFIEAAHAAYNAGAVLYAAGVDDQTQVTDLKVRAAPGALTSSDVAGLEAYARQLAADGQLQDPAVTVVEGAAQPTVDVRATARAERSAVEDGDEMVPVTVQVAERHVLGPRGVVYSLIVTSETPEGLDAVAAQVFDSLSFSPG